MARKHRHFFTQKETEYILRNAGKVPACVMAQLMKRNIEAVRVHASRHGISLRVPKEIMNKHWREYARGSKTAEA